MPLAGFLLFGVLIGGVVRMLVAGRAGGWVVSVMSGAAGSLVGGVFRNAGRFPRDPDSSAFSVSLLGAFTMVAVYHAVAAARRARSPLDPRRRGRGTAVRGGVPVALGAWRMGGSDDRE